ncbi:hypothetical protein BJY52DRAFT_1401034 [Lactarius psammicola]|nr:hypothetical protein BJY52DRAFT_1401034 [Lactarius psammicola]
MFVTRFVHYSGLLPAALLSIGLLATAAATATSDPCIKVAGLQFADPADAIACQKSFPFNETLRQNVLSVVSRVFDFYTFEDFYLNSPPPFQESTTNIRAEIARINSTHYEVSTLSSLCTDTWFMLNDGHTRWLPDCYTSYQNILPAPVVILDNGIFIAPDSVEFLNQSGSNFTHFFAAKKFNWQRLAGAKVITIGGIPAFDYIDNIARTVSGNYLDHNIRVNSAVSSYRIANTSFSQRLDEPRILTHSGNSSTPELVDVPFAASLIGTPFTDGRSYWANNCAANNQTNGVDLRSVSIHDAQSRVRPARGAMMDLTAQPKAAIGLPDRFLPTLPHTRGSNGVVKSFVLPGNKTGVFPLDVDAAVKQFKASGVTNLLIDVTNNVGGLVCLGMFLHQYLAGTESGFPGFQTTMRANPLAQKIVKAGIHQRHNNSISFYAPDSWQFLNGTQMPLNFNYIEPSVPFVINGRDDATSQRLEDICPTPNMTMPTKPPFDLNKVAIIGNGQCASTCATFTTAMFEQHQTKIAVFGGNPSQPIQYKGMSRYYWESGCSRWVSQTAGLKDDPLAPPDLLVSGHMFHNWRSAYSFLNEKLPIAYVSEEPQFRFPYTAETYNNPQKVWLFAEKQFFG